MNGHTPGPWTIDEFLEERGFYKIRAEDAVLCHAHSFSEKGTDPEALANARLIAAAPDLLKACKMVAEMAVSWEALTPGDIAEVKAAIAKAEGR